MTADVVNLRRFRKAKTRAERERVASQNRQVHGRTKVDRKTDAAERKRAEHRLAQHRRERDESVPD